MPGLEVRLGRITAHHAGKPDGTRAVGDAKHRFVHVHRLPFSSFSCSPGLAEAHVDAAIELVEVVDVQGPAKLQHHVVRHVDKGGYRTLPRTLEPLPHPGWSGRRRIDVADHTAGETSAAAGVDDPHRMAGRTHCRHRLNLGCDKPGSRQCRDLPRDTEQGQAIGSIGRELERENAVVECKNLADTPSGHCIRRQFEQAGVIVRNPQFPRRAQHALTLHAAHHRRSDSDRLACSIGRKHRADQRHRHVHAHGRIGRTANDRQRLPATRVDPANAQSIGLGVPINGEDTTGDDTGERRRDGPAGLDLDTGHRQQAREIVRTLRRIDKTTQPAFGELHGPKSRARSGPGITKTA